MSYARYWEGTTMVKNMHSKWADACGQVCCSPRRSTLGRALLATSVPYVASRSPQVLNFDRCLSSKCDLADEPFCCHIVRLFSQAPPSPQLASAHAAFSRRIHVTCVARALRDFVACCLQPRVHPGAVLRLALGSMPAHPPAHAFTRPPRPPAHFALRLCS